MVSNSSEYKFTLESRLWEVQPILSKSTASCHFVFSSSMEPLQSMVCWPLIHETMVSWIYTITEKEGELSAGPFSVCRNSYLFPPFHAPKHINLIHTFAKCSEDYFTGFRVQQKEQRGFHHCFDLLAGKVSGVFKCDYLMMYQVTTVFL